MQRAKPWRDDDNVDIVNPRHRRRKFGAACPTPKIPTRSSDHHFVQVLICIQLIIAGSSVNFRIYHRYPLYKLINAAA